MDEVLKSSISDMAGLSFQCSCGRTHEVDIKKIVIGSNKTPELVDIVKSYGGKAFLCADNNTYDISGKNIEEALKQAGVTVKTYVFRPEHGNLVPNEQTLGRLLIEMDEDTKVIVAVGSGTINDLSRELCWKTHIPYIIAGTAPSMDGYASVVSPIIIDHFKVSLEAGYADAIILDSEVLKTAPDIMIQAGFGDVLGKYNALTDWVLARELKGEYYCDTCVQLVKNALHKCVDNVDAIAARDSTALSYLAQGLVLSGLAIGLVGNSRPASGAEHHFSHYWEMDALKKDLPHPLHGNCVGVGTVLTAYIYQMLGDKIPAACHPQKPEYIISLLDRIGASSSPKTLGIDRELFHRSVIHAYEVRPRFTVLTYAHELGLLEGFADTLTEMFYD
jgi:glycerol-1-phosphate dehydrogenase [NAD(P)+]